LSRQEEQEILAAGYARLVGDAIPNLSGHLEEVEREFATYLKPTSSEKELPELRLEWLPPGIREWAKPDSIAWYQVVGLCSDHLFTRTVYAMVDNNAIPKIGEVLQATVRYHESFEIEHHSLLSRFVLRHIHRKGRPGRPPLPEDYDEDPMAVYWLDQGSPSFVVKDSSGISVELDRSWLGRVGDKLRELLKKSAPNDAIIRDYRRAVKASWWVPDSYALSINFTGHLEAHSYHANLRCPPGVYLEKAFLRALNIEGGRTVRSSSGYLPHGKRELIVVTEDDIHEDRGHLYFSHFLSERDAPADDYLPADLYLMLRPSYHNGLRAGMATSVLSTASLGLLLGRLVTASTLGPNDSTVSLLLVVLSLFVAVILRQEEHLLTKAVFSRYRVRLAVVGVAVFAVAIVVASGVAGTPRLATLAVATGLSLVTTLRTVWSGFHSRSHARRLVK
jgi:hypothetical protein